MGNEHVIFTFGADTSEVRRALTSISSQTQKTATNVISSMKEMGNSMKAFTRFNMLLSATQNMDGWMEKAKELGKWWGAFSVGGVKAVQQMQEAEASLERQYEKTLKLKAARQDYEKSQKELAAVEFKHLSLQEQASQMLKEQSDLVDAMKSVSAESWERKKMETELAIKRIAYEDKLKEIEKERADAKEKSDAEQKKRDEEKARRDKESSEASKDAARAIKQIESSRGGLRDARADFGTLSLSELAAMNPRGKNRFARYQIEDAKDVLQTEDEIKQARLNGADPEYIDRLINYRNKVAGGISALNDSEKNPFKAAEENIRRSEEHLSELLSAAKSNGLNVVISDVK